MKVDVITLHNINNYGSALQTYATQKIIESFGYNVEFIDYYRDGYSIESQVENNLKFSNIYNKNKLFHKIGKTILTKNIKDQNKVFKDFLKKNIKLSKPYDSYEKLKDDPPKADIYCVGSDQVWNSGWNAKIDKSFFLEFIKDKPKTSISSSFGKVELPDSEKITIKKYLEKFDSITVREKSAVELLETMQIKSNLVLDPTLIVNEDTWEQLINNKNYKTPEKYIFVYQLNTKSKKFDNYLDKIAKLLKLPVIRVSAFKHQRFKKGKLKYLPEIEEFLYLIKNSEYVITDSFHCTSFSIIFNKKFISIFPDNYSTRLENILNITGLVDRKADIEKIESIKNEIDYDRVNSIINIKRKESYELIKENFNIIERKKSGKI